MRTKSCGSIVKNTGTKKIIYFYPHTYQSLTIKKIDWIKIIFKNELGNVYSEKCDFLFIRINRLNVDACVKVPSKTMNEIYLEKYKFVCVLFTIVSTKSRDFFNFNRYNYSF